MSGAQLSLALLAACAVSKEQSSALPAAPLSRAQASASWAAAEQVFVSRCVVCHGCYDAPCQLKLDSYAGLTRGASPQRVYDGERLFAADLTRLDIDARDPQGWRKKGFHAVLPEDDRSDPRKSLLLRMLALKSAHPLPDDLDLGKAFTFELDRKQTCASSGQFDAYAKAHPLWGMPYGLPGLTPPEEAALTAWVRDGAPYAEPAPLSKEASEAVETWEAFLNQAPLKSRLMSRYLYEHLFLASLYFKDAGTESESGKDGPVFFRLVRSRTPPGAPVDEIATRRPFDDPKVDHLYYRFVRRTGTPLSKTHMVYPLGAGRLTLYRKLFLEPDYAVAQLPSYAPEVSANPFRAFAAIPAASRYRFLLTEAEFTLMGFIKGPVCRGQVALNVIEDRFWITFVDPAAPRMAGETAFLEEAKADLDLPAEEGSATIAVLWQHYEKAHDRYMGRRRLFLAARSAGGRGLGLDDVWDGDGANPNAALTVFRHFDTATVVQGLVGGPPQTAWVIDYPLLERIHYLLVAGFDVFGNVGHQVSTRVYMDFLRMEGETGFLALLPPARRPELIARWYRGVTGDGRARVDTDLAGSPSAPRIAYRTATPELELFELLRARVAPVLAHRYELPPAEAALVRLSALRGKAASLLPETSFLAVRDGEERKHFSLLRESAHSNVAHLFGESERRLQQEDALSVVPGFLGAYPNALFEVERSELGAFVEAVERLEAPAGYRALRFRYGVLRASPRFWPHSDLINQANHRLGPIDAGLFDYGHLEGL